MPHFFARRGNGGLTTAYPAQPAVLATSENERMFSLFQSVSRVRYGRGAALCLPEEIRRLGGRRVGILLGRQALHSGRLAHLFSALAAAGIAALPSDAPQTDPDPDCVARCGQWARENERDLLIGIGGGSVLDCTKAAALLACHDGPIERYYGVDKVPGPCLPTILLPTTAGTGSEMTSNTVISDTAVQRKVGVVSHYLYARSVILDPELTRSLPSFQTAVTGLDALVHAVESFVSRHATPFTDALNLQAMRMILGNIRRAVTDGQDMAAREQMLYGAALSGMAFSNTQNGIIHALGMSVPQEHHLPHGLVMAIFAPAGLTFNAPFAREKFARMAELFGSAPDNAPADVKAASVAEGFCALMRDLGITPGLAANGLPAEELPGIARRGAAYDRLMDSNPCSATAQELEALLRRFL